jgi:hypothetical protein
MPLIVKQGQHNMKFAKCCNVLNRATNNVPKKVQHVTGPDWQNSELSVTITFGPASRQPTNCRLNWRFRIAQIRMIVIKKKDSATVIKTVSTK